MNVINNNFIFNSNTINEFNIIIERFLKTFLYLSRSLVKIKNK